MKHPYLYLWTLLLVGFAAMLALSAFGDLSVFGHRLSSLYKDEPTPVLERRDAPKQSAIASSKTQKADTLTSGTILFIGDSMVEGLSPRLAAYTNASGIKLYTLIWYGSTTVTWAESHRLRTLVERRKPDCVIICLGGNELFVRNASERRNCVKSILADADTVPTVWIGPPNWKPDTGINDAIEAEIGESRFFRSAGLTLQRKSDGAHPTAAASAVWMDSIVVWLSRRPLRPVVFNKPQRQYGKADNTAIITPDD